MSHIVNNSWMPLLMSSSTFMILMSVLFLMKFNKVTFLLLSLTVSLLIFFLWFRDVNRESSMQGFHTQIIVSGLKWGLIWFLFSEVWFFISVFWTFFHMSMVSINSTMIWPNWGVSVIPPFQVPLLNTLILLTSGVTATLAHHEILEGNETEWLAVSSLLGLYFLLLQGMEYSSATFSISSGVYGSIFFFGTGFHGLHVCLGTLMLLSSVVRKELSYLSSHHHFGLEFSLWYWHFVDVVWLFLFFFVYLWGS